MNVMLDKISSSTKNIALAFEVELSEKIDAKEGNLIVVKALEEKSVYDELELVSGRNAKILQGDVIAGVLGERKALKGFVGVIPEKIKVGEILHILNKGGVIGECTSENKEFGNPLKVEVLGGILVKGKQANIKQNSIKWKNSLKESAPIIFVSGTCMNSGKTTAACKIIQGLNFKEYNVGAAKLTGVSLMRDTLNMLDHGAVNALSFTDAGLPSTTNLEEIIPAAKGIIFEMKKSKPDLIVIELGDGIFGGYGVDLILKDKEIMKFSKAHVMCANDPVGAWGALKYFEGNGAKITVMSGPTTDNAVGTEYVENKLNLPAANALVEGKKLAEIIEGEVLK